MMLRLSNVVLRTLLVAGALIVSAAHSGFAQDSKKVVIMTDWLPHGVHAGLFLALQKGWFKEAGLPDVEIQDGKGSAATLQLLAANQVDVGLVQLGTAATAKSNGLPVISIMGMIRGGENGFIVPQSGNYNKISDLKGKKIGIPSAGAVTPFYDTALNAGGLSRSDVTTVAMDNTVILSAYMSNQVDAVVSGVAYFLPLAAENKPSKGLLFADVGLILPGYGLAASTSRLKSDSKMLEKVVAVQQRAWTYINDGHADEAVDAIIAQRPQAKLDRKILLGQLKAFLGLIDTENTKGKPIGFQSEQDWAVATEAMAKVGLIKPTLKPSDFYTNEFIR